MRAQRDDGAYVYEYDSRTKTESPLYNEVRHAGVTLTLFQAAGRLDADVPALAAGDHGLDWMIAHLLRRDGRAALLNPAGEQASLGASALMTVGLAERRLATGDRRHDSLMRELGAFMVGLQRPDGRFYVAYDPSAGQPVEGTSRYYPGEALWALTLLYRAFPGEGWDRSARAAADSLATRRDEIEDVPFPPLADQWTAYGFAEMAAAGLTLTDAEALYARRLARRFGFLVRSESGRGDNRLGDAIRGPAPRGAGLGTWIEALAGLWRLAETDERLADLRGPIYERLACGAGILASHQTLDAGATALEFGAWYRDGVTRMHDQQHAFSAMLYTADALEGRTKREP
ncbi:MAG: hypothetical protein EXR43_00995 [Dehalococcoidia bacterium]|nr:hypothetical protein [Dehalococcoidia bacterium]